MLAQIKALFDLESRDVTAPLPEEQLKLACAALLIEVAVIDQEFDERELAHLHDILAAEYGIAEAELEALTEEAHHERNTATSLYQFTQIINNHCNPADKYRLVMAMWRIAYADGSVDKYEEYIIRKTSELLYVPHSDFIRAKHEARSQAE